ncbi:crotonase/enoyl-CoA hydratase family protein [Aquamicrobium sp. LC103]|uniref:crotonase/enoyl-CoA hydratase family protein n=1 Tax=Aquamicrobium sp. LC103 TaxID=1120658 RepID=UPI00063EC892|nr:crotonase/enoyl-CoA hydratase family protein [Aquamicrobium sp. LC103]TKT81364.1 crotonase/enoyl-CoA hydratase family protein [Aquamicrobium sp. LC103]
MTIRVDRDGETTIVTIDRPEARNAVDPRMADELFKAFVAFERDEASKVAVLTGVPGAFSAGFDLKHAAGGIDDSWFAEHDLDASFDGDDDRPRKGPMGPTRLLLSKPVIAAVSGPAVAGGMELALWCDLRVMEASAYMGVYCRRWGVPLIDGGTVRLPRIVGHGRAMDLILTGRQVKAGECLEMGLANRVCEDGSSLETALEIARELARFPQACMRADRISAIRQWSLGPEAALANEWKSVAAFRKEGLAGAGRFAAGKGRSGDFEEI